MNISCFHLRPGSSLLRFDIDATKKFNISLTEKWFVHFRLSKASLWLGRPNNDSLHRPIHGSGSGVVRSLDSRMQSLVKTKNGKVLNCIYRDDKKKGCPRRIGTPFLITIYSINRPRLAYDGNNTPSAFFSCTSWFGSRTASMIFVCSTSAVVSSIRPVTGS
ncbi:hypothetical protein GHH_c31680 [Geobacillus sp. GHH01]|nr:hypothetical protein GHH_c31680 [Geobacillus sp. GHH01]